MKILYDLKNISKEEYLRLQEYIYDFVKQESLIVENIPQYIYLMECAILKNDLDKLSQDSKQEEIKKFKNIILKLQ